MCDWIRGRKNIRGHQCIARARVERAGSAGTSSFRQRRNRMQMRTGATEPCSHIPCINRNFDMYSMHPVVRLTWVKHQPKISESKVHLASRCIRWSGTGSSETKKPGELRDMAWAWVERHCLWLIFSLAHRMQTRTSAIEPFTLWFFTCIYMHTFELWLALSPDFPFLLAYILTWTWRLKVDAVSLRMGDNQRWRVWFFECGGWWEKGGKNENRDVQSRRN
jgi:hypothetical protein